MPPQTTDSHFDGRLANSLIEEGIRGSVLIQSRCTSDACDPWQHSWQRTVSLCMYPFNGTQWGPVFPPTFFKISSVFQVTRVRLEAELMMKKHFGYISQLLILARLSFYPAWRMCSLNKMFPPNVFFSKLLVLFPPSKTSSTFDIRRWWRGSPNAWAGWDVWGGFCSHYASHNPILQVILSFLLSSLLPSDVSYPIVFFALSSRSSCAFHPKMF